MKAGLITDWHSHLQSANWSCYAEFTVKNNDILPHYPSSEKVKYLVCLPLQQCSALLLYFASLAESLLLIGELFKRDEAGRSWAGLLWTRISSKALPSMPELTTHIRPLFKRFEQSIYWLHSADPFAKCVSV